MEEEYDVAIIGGGISGLYTAWRLGKSTNLKVLVLESSDRFGGRYLTCKMPGGFAADLGPMRYLSDSHRILHNLVTEMRVETKMMQGHQGPKNKFTAFRRNQQIDGWEELRKLYSITDKDLPYVERVNQPQLGLPLQPHQEQNLVTIPEDRNMHLAKVESGKQLAKDMSVGQFLTLSNNPELFNLCRDLYPSVEYPLAIAIGRSSHGFLHRTDVLQIEGGFEVLIKKIVSKLSSTPNVKLQSNQAVLAIREDNSEFVLECENQHYKAQKVIYACSVPGIQNISFITSIRARQHKLQQLTQSVKTTRGFKIYLTYKSAWWEKHGLYNGGITTDLPIANVISFGENGKRGGYATLLAAYGVLFNEIFEGLDYQTHERFVNQLEEVREENVPSRLLVDYIQHQLKLVFGCSEIPEEPVCAAKMFWGTEKNAGISYYCKIGADGNKLHWESLKPFDDANIYITGDMFSAWDRSGVYHGFSETVLLASERILVNHFGLEPVVDELCLENPWPNA